MPPVSDPWLKLLQEALISGKSPENLPQEGGEWSNLIEEIVEIRSFAGELAKGNLNVELHSKGQTAGSLKSLQANLRHLAWQAQQIADGDLTQRIDYLGDFSTTFNRMAEKLTQSQKDLIASEERYRSIVLASPDGIAIIGSDLCPTFVSPQVLKIFGLEREEELLGKNILPWFVPAERNFLLERMQIVLSGTWLAPRRYTMYRKDGSTFPCEIFASVIYDNSGNSAGVLALTRDISSQMEQENQLTQSEKRYRLLAQNAHDVIWTMDLQGKFTYVSPSVEQLRGYKPEEVLQQNIEEALTPESAKVALEGLAFAFRLNAQGERVPGLSYELEQPCKDGSTVWTDVNVTGMYDDQGVFVGLLGVTRDITEKRRAQMAEQEQRMLANALRETTSALNSALSLEDVFQLILNNIANVVPYDAIDIMLIENNIAHISHCKGYEDVFSGADEMMRSIQFDVNHAENLRQIMVTHKPYLVDDIQKINWVASPVSDWIHSHLSVPILLKNEVVGVISLHSKQYGFFTQEHAVRLQDFSDQAALAFEKARLFDQLNLLATTDPLLGIANRRQFFSLAEKELARSRRYGCQLSLIMIDLDHFKRVNDNYGHTTGDAVLQSIARICFQTMRQIDTVARYGGEEIVILLPETGSEKAVAAAERLCSAIAKNSIKGNQTEIHVTASLGVAALEGEDTLETILNRADQAMYLAKQNGRNRVEFLSIR